MRKYVSLIVMLLALASFYCSAVVEIAGQQNESALFIGVGVFFIIFGVLTAARAAENFEIYLISLLLFAGACASFIILDITWLSVIAGIASLAVFYLSARPSLVFE